MCYNNMKVERSHLNLIQKYININHQNIWDPNIVFQMKFRELGGGNIRPYLPHSRYDLENIQQFIHFA